MRRRRRSAVDLRVDVGPVALPNPVVAASGTFGHGAELADVCDPSRLGAVTAKSVAAYPWEGNAPVRVTEAAGGGMLNSIGLPGPGVEAWIERDLPALEARGARVIASIWGRSVDEYTQAARALKTVAERVVAVEVNLSCPNVEERNAMFAHSCELTRDTITAVVGSLSGGAPVFAKLSPNVTDIVSIAGSALDAGASGLTLVNTVMGLAVDADARRPVLGAGGGGLSGPPIKPIALRAVRDVARAYPGTPIIATGGVTTGVDAVEMMIAGASAVGVGTATFAEPRAMLRIVDEISAWCARRRITRVRELIATLEGP